MIGELDRLGGVDRVVIEHADTDHYGALPQIVDRFDPEIYLPFEDQGFLPRAYNGIEATKLLDDGDEVVGFRAISIPGHTLGNMSFLHEGRDLLVAGDSVVRSDSDIAGADDWSGPLAAPADVFNRDTEAARSNLDALAGIEAEAILMTHGDDLESGGTEAIDTLLADLGLA
jgi:glyoxylase-like metal-dependent hydrolase (beta-lactamase superfamily II)